MNHDEQYMSQALRLASSAHTVSAPNPAVGCVIVRNGQVIGAGFTQPPGGNHAEIEALSDAAAKGHDVRGATVYVTLEPCSHFGRTPPCCDALIRAGVARVVAAIEDPNPLVAGQGLARLKAAGIEIVSDVLADEAREMNIGFFSRMQRGTPWVRMKVAASLDGKTALADGQSQWITSSAARDDGHAWRARAGAILTGIGTVNADDPQMTVRALTVVRQPLRIVIDSKLAISPDARVLAGGGSLMVAAQSNPEKEARLRDLGCEVIVLPNATGKVDLSALMQELGRRQINELHVEAGAKLNGSLIREGCVDELLLYLAPSLIGDGMPMFVLGALESLQHKRLLRFHEIRQIGEDLRILARFN
ncbi:MAG: bifunctional diaminohydroxyphosphoribosylaminopyrimidine deaminase/5-amino-6-(5-phosphoribosylamino)uracil reductase RibD [Oxalobacteraceae bacterium]|nr:bifunctional diaminohydroxyphosphoribosylaminopyrimidine deaminase/5-amino-6-(5-phosphoribosylamino)uracil reductase RibD [Oxalobacteraceae bacterium]